MCTNSVRFDMQKVLLLLINFQKYLLLHESCGLEHLSVFSFWILSNMYIWS